MQVTVQFWGAARRIAGEGDLPVTLDEGDTIGSLAQQLATQSEEMRALLRRCAFSVGTELLPRAHPLQDGDVVCVLPPVNGG